MPDSQLRQNALLILAYYFPPQNTSGAERPYRFAKYLLKYGVSPRVIAAGGFGDLQGWDNVQRVPDGVGSVAGVELASKAARFIQRFFLPYNEHLPWVPHAVRAAEQILCQVPISAILSTSPPVATHLAALCLKRWHKVKWVADFRDPLFGNPFRSRRLAAPYDAALERWIFRHADAVIANTAMAADLWRRRYPGWAHKIAVIWNGFDPEEELGPAPIPPRDHIVLSHVGNIYGGRDPQVLFSSLARLIDRGAVDPRKIRVRLVGLLDEPAFPRSRFPLTTLMEKGCLEITNSLVPRQEARRILAEADYLLLIDTNPRNAVLQLPSKLFDYIRVGRPILALTARHSPAERILAGSGVPYQCLYNDSTKEETDARLLEFLALPNDPVRASRWFWEQFNGESQTQALLSVLGLGTERIWARV